MKWILGFIIFACVLFVYIHITFHLRTSNELEIYALDEDGLSKDALEELCDYRQPVTFRYPVDEWSHAMHPSVLAGYGTFDISIRDRLDVTNKGELVVPLSVKEAIKLFAEDKEGRYLSERNGDFLAETGLLRHVLENDEFLRPAINMQSRYDLLWGSVGAKTPLRYDLSYRHYITVVCGTAHITLTPPKNSKYLHIIQDYENLEFRSAVDDIHNPAPQYKADASKVKCLSVELKTGEALYIPSYWLYQITLQQPDTVVCSLQYKTAMNVVSIVPQLAMYMLQNYNISRKVAPVVGTSVENEKVEV